MDRLTRVTDNTGATDYTYDQHGRVLTQMQTLGTRRLTVTYAYDSAGRMTEQVSPSGVRVDYRYDADRITDMLVNGQPALSALTYRPFGPARGWTFGNGETYQRQFDLDGRITTHTLGSDSRTIQYDAASRLTQLTDAANTLAFSYDPLDRLTGTRCTASRAYTYDANGNRTTAQVDSTVSTYTTETDSNRLLAITTGTTPLPRTYDALGNTLTDGRHQFRYDNRGRLIEARALSGATVASYRLNALGQRVQKTVTSGIAGDANGDGAFTNNDIQLMRRALRDGAAFQPVYDCDRNTQFNRDDLRCWRQALNQQRKTGAAPMATTTDRVFVYNTQGQLTAEYDALAQQWTDFVYFENAPVFMQQGAQRYYLHPDYLGTPRVATDAQQRIIWRWDSAPFGDTPARMDPDGDDIAVEINLRLAGQYFDAETGLHYNYFRDYDPGTGRYVQSDPIGLAGGLNTYEYALSAPTVLTDPSGLDAFVLATSNQKGGFDFFAFDTLGSEAVVGNFNNDTANFNQLREGLYTVSPRPELPDTFSNWLFDRNEHAGRPTISNTDDWNTIRYGDGTVIQGAQFHEGRYGTSRGVSQACMVSDRPTNNALDAMFKRNYNQGGFKLYIY